MQNMQRRFGKLLPRSADESQVAVLLSEFEDAEKMLARLIEATKAWRDSWRDVLAIQQRMIFEFQTIYNPIVGAGEGFSSIHEPLLTPQENMERVIRLQEGYSELKIDLTEEVNQVDERIIRPATEGKEYLHPMKKVIKKRQDRKLDYERYQGRFDAAQKKTKRTDRENLALAKHESDLARAKEEYNMADDKLKSNLPPIISAAFSLLPHLLAAQILIQNSLLGQYYTQLHNYCQDEQFPSPPPPATEIFAVWEAGFRPAQHEIETSIAGIAGGKAIRQPMSQDDRPGVSKTSLSIRNGFQQRKASSQAIDYKRPSVSPARSAISDNSEAPSLNYDRKPSPNPETRPKISSVPSSTSLALSMPNYNTSLTTPGSDHLSLQVTHSPAGPRSDYFSRDRIASGSMAAAAAAKKKPPPPPPKRVPSNQGFWVTALYDFSGQGQGDLSFREGDRIKVLKKTESTQDWWDGELKGIRGSFPANYCEP